MNAEFNITNCSLFSVSSICFYGWLNSRSIFQNILQNIFQSYISALIEFSNLYVLG